MDILKDAFDHCRNEDMRTPEVFAALDYVKSCTATKWPFDQFRKALEDNNEEGRWQTLNASFNGISLPSIQQFVKSIQKREPDFMCHFRVFGSPNCPSLQTNPVHMSRLVQSNAPGKVFALLATPKEVTYGKL